MPAFATTPTSGHLDVGDTWLLGVDVRRDDVDAEDQAGELVDATVTAVVVKPDATTVNPPVVHDGTGRYVVSYELAAAGRHTALVTAVDAVGAGDSVVAFAVDAAAPGGPPTLPQVKAYLGTDVTAHWDDTVITDTINAEIAAQAKVCRVGAMYPADLAEALKRRVARNLAMRGLPLGTQTQATDGAVQTTRVGSDPEIEAKEGPYRRFVFG